MNKVFIITPSYLIKKKSDFTGGIDFAFPVIHCPYIGHVPNKITLPIGAEVAMDTDRKQLVIRKTFSDGTKQ